MTPHGSARRGSGSRRRSGVGSQRNLPAEWTYFIHIRGAPLVAGWPLHCSFLAAVTAAATHAIGGDGDLKCGDAIGLHFHSVFPLAGRDGGGGSTSVGTEVTVKR